MLAELVKLAASLAAVFALAALVRALRLGGEARIRDAAHAIRLAEEAEVGFGGEEVALDQAGFAAIVRNAAGRQLLIRAHGTRFAAREIDGGFTGRINRDYLTLTPGDAGFGSVTLRLGGDAGRWASRMRELAREG